MNVTLMSGYIATEPTFNSAVQPGGHLLCGDAQQRRGERRGDLSGPAAAGL